MKSTLEILSEATKYFEKGSETILEFRLTATTEGGVTQYGIIFRTNKMELSVTSSRPITINDLQALLDKIGEETIKKGLVG